MYLGMCNRQMSFICLECSAVERGGISFSAISCLRKATRGKNIIETNSLLQKRMVEKTCSLLDNTTKLICFRD